MTRLDKRQTYQLSCIFGADRVPESDRNDRTGDHAVADPLFSP